LLLWAAKLPASAATISITPSTCQLDESNLPSEVYLSPLGVQVAAASADVTLRCHIQNPGTDSPYYKALQFTYRDASTAPDNYVQVWVSALGVSSGISSGTPWNQWSNSCAQGDWDVHQCFVVAGLTLDFVNYSYTATIRLRRTTANTGPVHAIAIQLLEESPN
jgi:hypothetical protein